MKKLNKEQIVFFIGSFFVVILLASKTIGFDFIINGGVEALKYQSSLDSIVHLESRIAVIQNNSFNINRDVFNMPSIKREIVQAPTQEVVVKKVQKNYKIKTSIQAWDRDKLEVLIIDGSRAKISVNGSAKQYLVGDQIQCANGVERKYDAETGEDTGESKDAGPISGVIRSIDKRNIFIALPGYSQAIRLNTRDGAKVIEADFLPQAPKSNSSESSSEEDSGIKIKKQR